MFDPHKLKVVSTDAFDFGLGASLTQVDDAGEEETVAFASRSLLLRGSGEENSCYAWITKLA